MTKLSGRTGQAFAQLLEAEATHATIENLYLRFDVPSVVSASNLGANKLTKGTNLVKTLLQRDDDSMLELIEYAALPSAKMSPAFRRGSAESLDLYASLERDLSNQHAPSPKVAPKAPARQFSRPGTTAPVTTPIHEHAAAAKRYVFVVRGRDQAAYDALAALLVSLDLRIVTWD